MKKIVTVTGGTGYIASWIVNYLLAEGHTVRTTVRDKSNTAKYQHLLDAAENLPGELQVFQAELLLERSFDDVVDGADYVMHTASPFFIDDGVDAQKKLVDPAVKGTLNVLNSVNKSNSVQRVVLTSSIAAIYGDNIDMQNQELQQFDETHWNTTSSVKHNAYSYSKTEAEKAAWQLVEQQSRWDLVTIHPGFVLGPSLTPRKDSTSITTLLRLLNGEFKAGSPNLEFVFSDVRDIAQGHILAAFTSSAKGRYIIANETGNLLDVGRIITESYQGKYNVPTRIIPKWLIWLVAPAIGLTRKFVSHNIDLPIKMDNSRSINDLQMQYRSLTTTVIEHVEQLQKDHLIKKQS